MSQNTQRPMSSVRLTDRAITRASVRTSNLSPVLLLLSSVVPTPAASMSFRSSSMTLHTHSISARREWCAARCCPMALWMKRRLLT